MTLFNNTKLAGSVLAVLACASFLSCSRSNDQAPLTDSAVTESTGSQAAGNAVGAPYATTTTTETASNTTLAADDTPKTLDTTGTVPPGSADEGTSAATTDKTTTETKKTKHVKKTKKAKKSAAAHKHAKPLVSNTTEDDSYYYDSDLATTDAGMLDPSQDIGAVDASQDFDETVSGTTLAPMTPVENGLSPFFHEPESRFPIQIGSGQMTGEDKSTTILEGPSLFQDPAALGRDIVR